MKKLSPMPLLIINSTLYIVHCTLYIFLLFSTGCKQTTEPGLEAELRLEAEDVSCTEAWIKLTTANLQLPATVNVYRNEIVGQTFSLSSRDTVLYIDSLLPRQTYRIKTTIQTANQSISSNELTVTTMDTTSHEFTFQSWTFGEHSSSALYDVAIIDENDIWAVGEIYMNDSLGRPDQNAYNAVHWDGTKWELKRIFTYSSCNPVDYAPLKAIWVISDTNIVVTSGGSIGWFNGKINKPDCNIRPLLTGSINKLWGSSSEDLYAVGNNGNIAHWDGRKWTRIESGTDVDLKDVWGTPDGKVVWVSGRVDLNKSVLIKIVNGQANIVFEDHYPWQIRKGRVSGGILSIWTNSTNFLYVTTPITVYRCLSNTDGEGIEIYPYDDYLNGGTVRIRGSATNSIITSGSNSSILHYNGLNWKRYEELNDMQTYLWSSDKKGNITVSVGDRLENIFYYKAIIIVGKK